MRFFRVDESERSSRTSVAKQPLGGGASWSEALQNSPDISPDRVRTHEIIGGGEGGGRGSGERLDEIAFRFHGDPRFWRLIAAFNNILDPLRIPPGLLLRIPLLPFPLLSFPGKPPRRQG